jgi:uncharacterized membrane protein
VNGKPADSDSGRFLLAPIARDINGGSGIKLKYISFKDWIALGLLLAILAVAATVFAHEAHNTASGNTNANTVQTSEANPADVSAAAPMNEVPAPTVEFPTLHPLVVHFPIVLIILAAAFQAISLIVFQREMSWAVIGLSLLGAIGAWAASNIFHPHTAGLSESAQRLLAEHELYAEYTIWLAAAGFAAKVISHFALKRKWWSEAVVTVLLAGAAITVSLAGHHGAELVHKEGIGPQGNFLETDDH